MTAPIGCAIYARYSSDRQSPTSIEDQVRQCRTYAAGHGWIIPEGCVYSDEAKTGTNDDRSGFRALCDAALAVPSPFDCILVDDTSRIARDQVDALRFYKRLAFAGIRLVAVSQGVDSASEQAELMLGVHGLIDSAYSRELALKTHRGMAGTALRGGATGGRCFGYRTEQARDGVPARQAIYEPEAATVRRIFELSAGGVSQRKIARLLNAEGIAPAQPYRGQRHPSWSTAALSVMLRNERYAGQIVWNRTKKVRHPETGKRLQRLRPESEWLRQERDDLRIVDRELFDRVQRRLAHMRSAEARHLCCRTANYLLSGLLVCAQCGSKMVVYSGRAPGSWKRLASASKYSCPLADRGVCSMTYRPHRLPLENAVLAGLQARLCAPEVQKLIRAGVVAELARQRGRAAEVAKERNALKGRIDRLADLIAAGNHSPALLARLRAMEGEYSALAVIPPKGAAVELCDGILGDIQAVLAEEHAAMKPILSKYLRLTGDADGVTVAVLAGAGGRNRTAHASLFRAALYH
jgi:site-specific DNA recombinase